MTDPAAIEATILMEKISNDPIASYLSLLEFSKKYALGADVHRDVVLLGSVINDLIETEPDAEEVNEYRAMIREKSTAIVAGITRGAKTMGLKTPIDGPDHIQQHFLEQKPRQRTIFSCTGISRRISSRFSMQDISLDLRLGEITGVVGENGNGKTTLLRIIAGELKAGRGTCRYQFEDKSVKDWMDIKRRIGYVQQTLFPWRGISSVREQLKFTAAMKGMTGRQNQTQFEFIISRLNLEEHQDKLWSELSGGYKLRFELARQLIWQPQLLILDEPLASLDVKSQLTFLNDLRNLTNSISNSMAVIISSQNLYEIEKISDHVIFMRDGQAIYNGHARNIGKSNNSCCYEIDVAVTAIELQLALQGLPIREIRTESFYKLIFTDESLDAAAILQELGNKNIPVLYFRDITRSTRLLFEK